MVAALAPANDSSQDDGEYPVITAEKSVLGAMLTSGAAIEAAVEMVAPRDFLRPAHQIIANRIVTMHAVGEHVGPITVAHELEADGDLSKCGGRDYLHTLYSAGPVAAASAVTWHARIVADAATLRRIEAAGTRMVSRARTPGTDPSAIIAGAERDLADVVTFTGTDAAVMDIGEFCTADIPHSEPLIPGLLHAAERVIVVAPEGLGKTTLARQVWVMTAAGLHPFTGRPIPPKRTLYLDLENPPSIVQAKTRPLLDLARQQPGWNDGRARIWSRPGGIDVRQPADAQQLAAVIKAAAPDLIVGGPLYKMTVDGGERAEQLHSAVAAFWDRMRDKHGVALWLEAHAPMAQAGTQRDLRPLGSGIWQRWPEFGISLRPDPEDRRHLKIGRFRGDRDERQWPARLVRPAWGEPWRWPWKAEYPKGTFGPESAA